MQRAWVEWNSDVRMMSNHFYQPRLRPLESRSQINCVPFASTSRQELQLIRTDLKNGFASLVVVLGASQQHRRHDHLGLQQGWVKNERRFHR